MQLSWIAHYGEVHETLIQLYNQYLYLIARTSTGIRDELVHGRKGQNKDHVDKCSHENDNDPVPPREAPSVCRTPPTGT